MSRYDYFDELSGDDSHHHDYKNSDSDSDHDACDNGYDDQISESDRNGDDNKATIRKKDASRRH